MDNSQKKSSSISQRGSFNNTSPGGAFVYLSDDVKYMCRFCDSELASYGKEEGGRIAVSEFITFGKFTYVCCPKEDCKEMAVLVGTDWKKRDLDKKLNNIIHNKPDMSSLLGVLAEFIDPLNDTVVTKDDE